MTTLASTVQGAIGGHWMPLAGSNLTLVEVTATDLSSSSGAVGTNTTTQTGGGSQTVLNASSSAVMNHNISRRYRGGKPRTYMPGVMPSDLSGSNEISSTAQTAFNSAWSNAINQILSVGGMSITLQDIVNVSFYEGFTAVQNPVTGRWRNVPKLRATPLVDPIRSTACAQKLGSQRRRLNV